MELDLNKFNDCIEFINNVNKTPLNEIKIDGKYLPKEDIKEFKFTGLSNKDYFLMFYEELGDDND